MSIFEDNLQVMYKGHFEQSIGKNLFDEKLLSQIPNYNTYDNATKKWICRAQGYSTSILYFQTGSNMSRIPIDITKLIPITSGTYTITFYDVTNETLEKDNDINVGFVDKDGNFISFSYLGIGRSVNNRTKSSTFSVPENTAYMDIRVWMNTGIYSFSKIQLEKGSTATPYTPYGINYEIKQPNGDNLRDYKIYGNSYQAYEPSIDNPCDVISLGESKSRNLWNVELLSNAIDKDGDYPIYDIDAKTGSFKYLDKHYKQFGNGRNKIKDFFPDLVADRTYRILADKNGNEFIWLQWGTSSGKGWWFNYSDSAFTMTEDIINGSFQLYYGDDGVYEGVRIIDVTDTDQVTAPYKDNPKLSFIPYGRNIDVNVKSKNLFNENLLNQQIDYTTYDKTNKKWKTAINRGYSKSFFYNTDGNVIKDVNKLLKLSPGIYTFTFFDLQYHQTEDRFSNVGIYLCDINGNIINRISIAANQDDLVTMSTQIKTIEILEGSEYIDIVRTHNTGYFSFSKIQIEKGSTATTYVPYYNETTLINLGTHEPLRKISNNADYIDFRNKKIFRKIIHHSLPIKDMNNGEQYPGWANLPNLKEFFPGYNNSINAFTTVISNINSSASKTVDYNMAANTQYAQSTIYFNHLRNENITQSMLKEMYPDLVVEIYYALPDGVYIEEDFPELPDIPTPEYDCTISISSGTDDNALYYLTSNTNDILASSSDDLLTSTTVNKDYKIGASKLALEAYVK